MSHESSLVHPKDRQNSLLPSMAHRQHGSVCRRDVALVVGVNHMMLACFLSISAVNTGSALAQIWKKVLMERPPRLKLAHSPKLIQRV